MSSVEQESIRLPAAELEVLACIRHGGSVTAREVRERMEAFRPMTHGAVVTLLKRLEDKGLVQKEKGPVGKAFLFSARRGAEGPLRNTLTDMLKRLFQGNGVAFVASLFETKPPTLDEVEKLEDLLKEARRSRNVERNKKKGTRK